MEKKNKKAEGSFAIALLAGPNIIPALMDWTLGHYHFWPGNFPAKKLWQSPQVLYGTIFEAR